MNYARHIAAVCILLTGINFITSGADNLNNPLLPDTTSGKKPVRQYTTSRLTAERPVVDGHLDDACWQTGTWSGDFTQFIPAEGAKPTFPTELKIFYDDQCIYVAIRAHDPEPAKINRKAAMRDEISGDMVGINFDSYHDHRTGFEFNLAASGQKVDLVLSNPMAWDVNWNAVWTGKVAFEDSAWTAEIEVPLTQLRYSAADEQVWGIHVWRWIDRLQEESDWEVQSLTGPGMLYNFGELHGISGLKKRQRLEVMPYSLGNLKTFAKEPGNPFSDKGRSWGGNAGLDAKVGISSNFTVDVTFNPDFGQVESDPSVMNLTAFETFYEEKRPFFLEAQNIFRYEFDDLNLFYSRRIGHSPSFSVPTGDSLYSKAPDRTTILSAVKLSGKTAGGLAVGFLHSLTQQEFAELSDPENNRSMQAIEPLSSYSVARIQKDYHEGTTVIGGIFTATNRFIHDKQLEFLSRNAYSGGLDFLHQWKDKKYYLDMRLVGSLVQGETDAISQLQLSSARYFQRPGVSYLRYDTSRTELSGTGGRIRLGKGTGLWRYHSGLSWYSPGLELNDLGYMQSVDAIENENEISYFVNQPVSIFRTYTISLEQFNRLSYAGKYLGSGAHFSFSSEFKNKWGWGFNLIYQSESSDTHILRGGPEMRIPAQLLSFGGIRTDGSKPVFISMDYSMQRGFGNSSNMFMLEPGLVVKPINSLRLRLSCNYGKNSDGLQYVNSLADSGAVLGKLNQQTLGLTFRLDFSLSPELTLQYYGSPFVSKGSYARFNRVTDPLAKKLDDRYVRYDNYNTEYDFNFQQFRSNLVVKWEYRPGSYLFLVWADDRTNPNGNPADKLVKSMQQLRKIYPGNVFLIKFSYWFSL
ncbi:MAG: DUF5916 domain-containing protein [Bacteroidales bacterium]